MSDALEALERVERFALMTDCEVADLDANTIDSDIATIRAALEQGEAVAWRWECHGEHVTTDSDRARRLIADGANLQPLYAAPPSTAEQWKPSGAEYDRSIHSNTDAASWADFFMATFPNCGADWATMVGWFANAMMTVADSQPSTAEAVVWQYTGEDGEECYTTIKAKALQFDANPTPLYTAPPSMAEAQARALEEVADKISAKVYDALTAGGIGVATRQMRDEAKRIRGEG